MDRKEHVTVNFKNIATRAKSNFEMKPITFNYAPYDLESDLQYGKFVSNSLHQGFKIFQNPRFKPPVEDSAPKMVFFQKHCHVYFITYDQQLM
jgi:hypothetical protein